MIPSTRRHHHHHPRHHLPLLAWRDPWDLFYHQKKLFYHLHNAFQIQTFQQHRSPLIEDEPLLHLRPTFIKKKPHQLESSQQKPTQYKNKKFPKILTEAISVSGLFATPNIKIAAVATYVTFIIGSQLLSPTLPASNNLACILCDSGCPAPNIRRWCAITTRRDDGTLLNALRNSVGAAFIINFDKRTYIQRAVITNTQTPMNVCQTSKQKTKP